jgi:competence protein ComEA
MMVYFDRSIYKTMLPEKLRAYFSFTKKERAGVIALISLIGIIFILPYFFPLPKDEKNQKEFEQFKNEIAQLKTQQKTDSSHYNNRNEEFDNNNSEPSKNYSNPIKAELFYFDPNTINEEQWKKLGLRNKTIHTIENYINKGGKFHSPQDLQKIYGLHNDEYERLSPYIKIENPTSVINNKITAAKSFNNADNKPSAKGELFYFDPNTISPEQWKTLGLRDKTISTIQNYISKGGKFRSAEDLKKIYGLHNDEFERLSPYVKIENQSAVINNKNSTNNSFNNPSNKKKFHGEIIDINTADTTALTALPGIGSKLANRIISFREKLGGFFSVDQIAETYALPDSTFIKIKPFLKTNSEVKKININTADANILKQHPYVKWNLANAIIQYRNQHGAFKSVNDLQQIALITPEIFRKISAYLEVGNN